VCEHCNFDSEIFYLAQFTTPTKLALLISCKLFQKFCLKMSFIPILILKFSNNIGEFTEHTL
jgi:hypothetical protein